MDFATRLMQYSCITPCSSRTMKGDDNCAILGNFQEAKILQNHHRKIVARRSLRYVFYSAGWGIVAIILHLDLFVTISSTCTRKLIKSSARLHIELPGSIRVAMSLSVPMRKQGKLEQLRVRIIFGTKIDPTSCFIVCYPLIIKMLSVETHLGYGSFSYTLRSREDHLLIIPTGLRLEILPSIPSWSELEPNRRTGTQPAGWPVAG